jgi:hypothetical protein
MAWPLICRFGNDTARLLALAGEVVPQRIRRTDHALITHHAHCSSLPSLRDIMFSMSLFDLCRECRDLRGCGIRRSSAPGMAQDGGFLRRVRGLLELCDGVRKIPGNRLAKLVLVHAKARCAIPSVVAGAPAGGDLLDGFLCFTGGFRGRFVAYRALCTGGLADPLKHEGTSSQ